MTRKSIVIASVVYLVAALAFGAFIQLTKPFPYTGSYAQAALIGEIVGGGVGAYVTAGLLPMIAWAIMRFRAAKAAGPFIAWGILGVVYMALSATGISYERKEQITQTAANIASLSGGDYERFVRSMRQSCTDVQRKSQINRASGITDQQIATYCQCYATAMAKEVTADEIAYFAGNGQPSETFRQKADRVAPTCTRLATGR
jgi:hypothetical protein